MLLAKLFSWLGKLFALKGFVEKANFIDKVIKILIK